MVLRSVVVGDALRTHAVAQFRTGELTMAMGAGCEVGVVVHESIILDSYGVVNAAIGR